MEIRFWGVRGSIAASGAHVARIGGNTSCVEVRSQGYRLILDAGTGVRALGEAMLREGASRDATLLFSHLHWDHVQGFPFFTPAYLPGTQLRLFGPGPEGGRALRTALEKQMTPPAFPVTLAAMRGQLEFGDALAGHAFETGPFRITPFALSHPQGSMGYRVEADGASFVYATDVELSLGELGPEAAIAMHGADALCLDAQYTPEEYDGRAGIPKKGWGHSTMVEAAKVAFATGARRLFLFHHDPAHNDETVERMAEAARAFFQNSEPAREGALIRLGEDAVPWVA